MIQVQLKLRLNSVQTSKVTDWLVYLTSVWNWAIRKIELDWNDRIYHGPRAFRNILANHCEKLGMPSHTLQGMLAQAHLAWVHRFKKVSGLGRPKLKGRRNKLNSIPFPDPINAPIGNFVKIPGLGKVKFYNQKLPEGKIKCGRVLKRASGWYLCLIIDTEPKTVPIVGHGHVGIDPGFKSLLTLSNGEKVEHPREYEKLQKRLGKAQRGANKKLTARLHERIRNQRKDRNHKLSRRLVSENELIVFSADDHSSVKKIFGKSVTSSGHYQLRRMLAYKCRTDGRQYVEVDPKFSTMTCSDCGCLSGPTGLRKLDVRHWECRDCGSLHDRDINAAMNTLKAGAGCAHGVLKSFNLG